jgi:hypothetical protein
MTFGMCSMTAELGTASNSLLPAVTCTLKVAGDYVATRRYAHSCLRLLPWFGPHPQSCHWEYQSQCGSQEVLIMIQSSRRSSAGYLYGRRMMAGFMPSWATLKKLRLSNYSLGADHGRHGTGQNPGSKGLGC